MTEEPNPLPPTDMLYMSYEGNQLLECTAKVLQVVQAEDDSDTPSSIVLDRTVMHAQGGGQPTDLGVISSASDGDDDAKQQQLQVSKVVMDRSTGVAQHTGKFFSTNSNTDTDEPPLRVGDQVKVSVDAGTRRVLSECHTAGHVVDSAMARCGKFLKPSKAYHFLQGPYVEYEGSVPVEEREVLLQDLQTAFCQLVDEKIDTEIQVLSKQEADAICNRQAQNFDMDVFADPRHDTIRVVTVAGFPCPCGGTHVNNTSDLRERQWSITGIKSKKGVVRVKYNQNAKTKS